MPDNINELYGLGFGIFLVIFIIFIALNMKLNEEDDKHKH